MDLGKLLQKPFKDMGEYAQFNEEEILAKIFKEIGTTNKFAVEFGCHPTHKFSNIKHLEKIGWTTLYMSEEEGRGIKKEWITAENINDLFKKYGVPEKPDFVSIDIDGMDYWIWKALKYQPRVVCIEYNPQKANIPIQGYNPNNKWNKDNDWVYGATKEEMIKLGTEKGYTFYEGNSDNLIFKLYEKNTRFMQNRN